MGRSTKGTQDRRPLLGDLSAIIRHLSARARGEHKNGERTGELRSKASHLAEHFRVGEAQEHAHHGSARVSPVVQ